MRFTLVTTWIGYVLCGLAELPPRHYVGGWRESPARATMLSLYAFETAYMRFLVDHEVGCPSSLDELLRYTDAKSTLDGWGSPIDMTCPFAVRSRGPDRKLGTDDDVTIRAAAYPPATSSRRVSLRSPD